MAAPPKKVKKVTTQPVNLLFRFFQTKAKVEIWLYENIDMRLEGKIMGFDEYMNITLDDAEEVKELGRIILKGDNITLIRNVE